MPNRCLRYNYSYYFSLLVYVIMILIIIIIIIITIIIMIITIVIMIITIVIKVISNGNRTEWSTTEGVARRVNSNQPRATLSATENEIP